EMLGKGRTVSFCSGASQHTDNFFHVLIPPVWLKNSKKLFVKNKKKVNVIHLINMLIPSLCHRIRQRQDNVKFLFYKDCTAIVKSYLINQRI
ncbi:MAG: hypothetical protein BWK80_28965, partial [Desulfobacteraceae bacterium IS3]